MSVPQGPPRAKRALGSFQKIRRSARWQRGLCLDWTGRLSAGDSAPSPRDDLVIGVTEFVAVRGEILVHLLNALFSHLSVPVTVGFRKIYIITAAASGSRSRREARLRTLATRCRARFRPGFAADTRRWQ